MNDLVSQETVFSWVRDTMAKFEGIRSFEDLERTFLRNRGLSGCTYATYTQAVKSAYVFLDKKHPLSWTASDIEAFYDSERARNSIATASARLAGLKSFCAALKADAPFWKTPFEMMTPETLRKLSTPPKPKQKAALYGAELRAVLAFLEADKSQKGLQNKAIVLFLFSTGLRAAELCALNWGNLEHDTDTGKWYVSGIGKGSKPYKQELHPDAVAALLEASGGKFRGTMQADKPLFLSLASYRGKERTRLTKAVLWLRLREIGDALKARGQVRQDVEFSAHLFRRSYLTLLSKQGMSLKAIQGISRHSNIETLARHYVDDTESPKAYLDAIFGKAVSA